MHVLSEKLGLVEALGKGVSLPPVWFPVSQVCDLSLDNHGRKDYESGAHVERSEITISLRVECSNTFQSSHM